MASADFSQVTRAFDRLQTEAERLELDLRLIARRRARQVYDSAVARLPRAGESRYATGASRAALRIVEPAGEQQIEVEFQEVPGRHPMFPFFLEFGTGDTAARPALRPAVDEGREQYQDDVLAALQKGMNRV